MIIPKRYKGFNRPMAHNYHFEIIHEDPASRARVGRLHLNGLSIETPIFMPVGTLGMVKALDPWEVEEMGYNLLLTNTYHLYLRPGLDVIGKFGGLKKLTGWNGLYLSDSGGFQIHSLSKLVRLKEEGAYFRSHIDGSEHFFSPEKVLEIQSKLGSDIWMPLDHCTENGLSQDKAKEAMTLTLRWLKRAKAEHDTNYKGQSLLFGITQGNFFDDLRKESTERTVDIDFDGYAIGGLSVGEIQDVLCHFVDLSTERLPKSKPRYLMGVGEVSDMLESVSLGIDMFDSVFPTRCGRNGTFFTFQGRRIIKNNRYTDDEDAIDPDSKHPLLLNLNKAYLRHLFKSGELLAKRLLSIQNIDFYNRLFVEIRKSILENRFIEFKNDLMRFYEKNEVDEDESMH